MSFDASAGCSESESPAPALYQPGSNLLRLDEGQVRGTRPDAVRCPRPDNIAFLLGEPAATAPNAQTVEMTATFWIETVRHIIFIPVFTPGQPPLRFPAEIADRPVATFLVDPPVPILRPIPIVVTSTQIQYSQTVMLNSTAYSGLTSRWRRSCQAASSRSRPPCGPWP